MSSVHVSSLFSFGTISSNLELSGTLSGLNSLVS